MNVQKSRREPHALSLLHSLSTRMNLSTDDERYYNNLRQGYSGECQFDQMVSDANINCMVLNDLLLENNHTEIQIDSILINQGKLYLIEIKNYEGDYYIQVDRWYSRATNNEIKNPLLQLKRTETVLRQIFQKAKINIEVEALLVFINPQFVLYHASPTYPIIFYPQLTRFLKKLSGDHLLAKDKKIVEYLLSQQIPKSRNVYLPKYSFEQLKRGIMCPDCGAEFIRKTITELACETCGYVEYIDDGIIRAFQEFRILFPDETFTTQKFYEFCGGIVSKHSCIRVLKKKVKLVSCSKKSYFHID